MKIIAVIATGAAVLASAPAVQGHGYTVEPAAQWTQGYPSNGYGATIDSKVWGEIDRSKYSFGPSGTVKFFNDMLVEKEDGTLAAFIAKNQKLYSNEIDPECGLTAYKESARSKLPESAITFTGFTHPGPCEVRCDGTKVLFAKDCQTKYPGSPAKIPYDKSMCANANRMTVYWIAMHGEPWQVYTNCVWLEGGSGRGSAPVQGAGSKVASDSDSSTTTTTASANTSSSTPTEVAGEASSSVSELFSSSAAEEPASPLTTDALSTSTTSQKCARRK